MEINYFLSVAKAIETLLCPYAEVVLHDLKTNRIVEIFNSFSQRRPGDDSLLDVIELNAIQEKKTPDIIGPYEKINWDGRPLKSISAILHNQNGKPIGLMCINLDVSHFHDWQRSIDLFLKPQNLIAQPPVLFKDDWQERINQFIHQTINQKGKTIKTLSRAEKHELIVLLDREGAFNGKNAAAYIGKLLEVSRATVYKVLAIKDASMKKKLPHKDRAKIASKQRVHRK